MEGILKFVETGGFTTWGILIAAVFLVFLAAERFAVLFGVLAASTRNEEETIRSLILQRKYPEAVQVCNQKTRSPHLVVMKNALLAAENGREAMRSALGSGILQVTHKCEARLGYISLIANVATLLGLLGTITGLMITFESLGQFEGEEKARRLGLGIAEAMNSTAAGLIVGVIAMVLFSILSTKSEGIIGGTQDSGLNLLTWVEQAERAPKNV